VRVFVAFSKAHAMKVSSFVPKESKKEFEDEETPQWVFEAREFLLRKALNLPSRDPNWLELPAMMRMVVTTPNVFKAGRFRSITRQFSAMDIGPWRKEIWSKFEVVQDFSMDFGESAKSW
jgi:hypothetical protein